MSKTSELTATALDWAVAKCEEIGKPKGFWTGAVERGNFQPSTDWSQGGPIIERERIAVWGDNDTYWEAECGWSWAQGETPLVAAMRCYVGSQLGDEVEIPERLGEVTA